MYTYSRRCAVPHTHQAICPADLDVTSIRNTSNTQFVWIPGYCPSQRSLRIPAIIRARVVAVWSRHSRHSESPRPGLWSCLAEQNVASLAWQIKRQNLGHAAPAVYDWIDKSIITILHWPISNPRLVHACTAVLQTALWVPWYIRRLGIVIRQEPSCPTSLLAKIITCALHKHLANTGPCGQ